ncbi:hypothetical protein NPIL_355051, partial [Nephila pilipes]
MYVCVCREFEEPPWKSEYHGLVKS